MASATAELVYVRDIAADRTLGDILSVLRENAPAWFEDVHLRDADGRRRPEAVNPESIVAAAMERGPLYRALEDAAGTHSRSRFGTVELRGANSALIVVVGVDDEPQRQIGDAVPLGNSVSLQVRGDSFEKRSRNEWLGVTFAAACDLTAPWWGAIYAHDEYDAKVMSSGDLVSAIGRDFSRYLPGVFAVNFYGEELVALFGTAALREARSEKTFVSDAGVRVVLRDDPAAWDEPAVAERERIFRDAVGREHFFEREQAQ